MQKIDAIPDTKKPLNPNRQDQERIPISYYNENTE